MLETPSAVSRSVQLNETIMGTGPVADSRATLVYNALGINQDRFEKALRSVCGEVRMNPSDPNSSVLEPGMSEHLIFWGALFATAKQRGVEREGAGFPLGSWKGKDGKDKGERNLYFVPSITSGDSPSVVVEIIDPNEPKRNGAIRLWRERIDCNATYTGDIRLLPPDFRPNFGIVANLNHRVQNAPVNDHSLKFITQAALEQLGI